MPTYKVKICNKEVEINKIRSKAIKAYCTDCSAGSRTDIKECPSTMCPLYPFRGYVNFGDKREYTEEEKDKIRERLKRSLKR